MHRYGIKYPSSANQDEIRETSNGELKPSSDRTGISLQICFFLRRSLELKPEMNWSVPLLKVQVGRWPRALNSRPFHSFFFSFCLTSLFSSLLAMLTHLVMIPCWLRPGRSRMKLTGGEKRKARKNEARSNRSPHSDVLANLYLHWEPSLKTVI